MDFIRFVFDRLAIAGSPDADERARIHAECRNEVATAHLDEGKRARAMAQLEKVIRREEMPALYEESLRRQ